MAKSGCLQLKIYTSELLNLSVETMNSIVEDIIDLLQDKSNLLSPYRSVFVISLSCFFKMLSLIFLILIERDCLADWKVSWWFQGVEISGMKCVKKGTLNVI